MTTSLAKWSVCLTIKHKVAGLTPGTSTIYWTWRHFYSVSTYTYSLLIEKDIYDCWNVSVKLPCIYVCLSSGDLFSFSVRVSSFFSYFCVIRTSALFFSTWSPQFSGLDLDQGHKNNWTATWLKSSRSD